MAREIDPRQTRRADAMVWLQAPMPMVTLTKTLDVTGLVRFSRLTGCGFHPLLCWCIGRAAARCRDFYLLPVDGKLMQYDKLAINTVVALDRGGIQTCDVPFSPSLDRFCRDYQALTGRVRASGQPFELDGGYMVIGTSALVDCELDSAVNIYAGMFNNPFLIWGRWRKTLRGARLPISFQFHHTQMDGRAAARFLALLQYEITFLGHRNGGIIP